MKNRVRASKEWHKTNHLTAETVEEFKVYMRKEDRKFRLIKEINVVKIKIDNSAYGDTTVLENLLKRLEDERAQL